MTRAVELAQVASLGVSEAFKNRIINGAMVIDQRNAGASVTITNTSDVTYTLDRWFAYGSAASKFSVQQDAGAVTPPAGFNDYLGATSLSAYSITSGDSFSIGQPIEGFNVADLNWGTANAKTVTLSFWVRSSLTGTFGGSLRNSAANRSYPYSYTISAANTWEQKSVTIAGDTTGTWLTTNGIGIRVGFGIGVGSTASNTAGAWAAGNFNSATGATSVVGTNGATWFVTGVQLEVGSSATSFEYVNYQTLLAQCQRYYYRISNTSDATSIPFALAYTRANNAVRPFVNFPVQMRVRPTGLETSGTASHYVVYYAGDASAICNAVPDFDISSRETALLGAVVGGSPFPSGGVCYLRSNSTSAYLGFSAEL
jgi:hypothetical protein